MAKDIERDRSASCSCASQSGAWLCDLREKRGLSQRELAKRVGAEFYSVISQLETGLGRIPPDRCLVWANALGVEPREFVRTLTSYYEPQSTPRATHVERSAQPSPNVDKGQRQRLATK